MPNDAPGARFGHVKIVVASCANPWFVERMDNALARVQDPVALVNVKTSQAGADHLVAWTAQQRATAVHEAGHAVIARVVGIPVKSVSIKERWGGRTESSEEDDDQLSFYTWAQVLDKAMVSLAGLAVTEVALGERMSGSHSDMINAAMALSNAMEAGMDPDPSSPFVCSLTRYDAMKSNKATDARVARVEVLLRQQYKRALEMCERYQREIVAFATIIFEKRRLSDGALEDAFQEVGI